MPNPIPPQQRLAVETRDLSRCVRCFGNGSEWHHRRSRSIRDDHCHCTCNGVILCSDCHRWVHGHPFEARGLGLIVLRSIAAPKDVPLEHVRYGTVTLTCDGLAVRTS